ncbi:hypothetical protein [Rhodococcoides fascians]|uniref:hypothetical protein n=1 Tax=Rhodococcoides fascians TaxID=1828 RepID=UPI00050C4C4F|nr:hypothetical protein [Rhodococcus fascians]
MSGRMPGRPCPHCKSVVDATMAMGNPANRPSPGDVNVCVYCAGVSLFTEDGFRLPTASEARELELVPQIQHAIRKVQDFILNRAL